jgi:hypothetical protein
MEIANVTTTCRMWPLFYLLVVGVLSLYSLSTHARYPLPPRFSANAYASGYTVGNADLMVPVSSNFCTHNLYLDPMVEYATDNNGYADLGVP